jgi:hypothetical protein
MSGKELGMRVSKCVSLSCLPLVTLQEVNGTVSDVATRALNSH